jgi:hypothetical protein
MLRGAVMDIVTEKTELQLTDWLGGIAEITIKFADENLSLERWNKTTARLYHASKNAARTH